MVDKMPMTPVEVAKLARTIGPQLRAEAARRGVAADLIRKQYVFTLFLGRLFSGPTEAPWVLLGGNALLIRTGGGRFTQDVDLARESDWDDLEDVRTELQHLADRQSERDPFTFEIYKIEVHSEEDPFGYGAKTAKAKVRVSLGNAVFDQFSIDITSRRHVDSPVDMIPLRAVIDHHTLADLPRVPTTPAENHLADKVCAMYELHGPSSLPSTRYRDLADIVRLIRAAELDAARLIQVLRREEGRRKITLPLDMTPPAPEWEIRFAIAARGFAEYPTDLHPLAASLTAAAACLTPILSGERTDGTWMPESATWTDAAKK